MAVPKLKGKEAYVHVADGIFYVIAFPSQRAVCRSKHFRRATRKARNLGYDVTVMRTDLEPMRDASRTTWSSWVLVSR